MSAAGLKETQVETLLTLIMVALLIMAAAATFSIFRGLRGPIAAPRRGPVPPIDPYPPVPVEPGPGTSVTGVAAIAWAALQVLAVAASLYLAYRWGALSPAIGMMAGYAVLACALTLAGGALLLKLRPLGRKLLAWGMFLLAWMILLTVSGLLVIPDTEEIPALLREAMPWVVAGLLAHLAVDVALGIAAQRAGRPSPPQVQSSGLPGLPM